MKVLILGILLLTTISLSFGADNSIYVLYIGESDRSYVEDSITVTIQEIKESGGSKLHSYLIDAHTLSNPDLIGLGGEVSSIILHTLEICAGGAICYWFPVPVTQMAGLTLITHGASKVFENIKDVVYWPFNRKSRQILFGQRSVKGMSQSDILELKSYLDSYEKGDHILNPNVVIISTIENAAQLNNVANSHIIKNVKIGNRSYYGVFKEVDVGNISSAEIKPESRGTGYIK